MTDQDVTVPTWLSSYRWTSLIMLATISTGQFIGGCVENLIWVGVGAYVVWFWPRGVRRAIELGKTTEEQGAAKLKKFNPRLGYLIIIFGLVRIAEEVSRYYKGVIIKGSDLTIDTGARHWPAKASRAGDLRPAGTWTFAAAQNRPGEGSVCSVMSHE